MKGLAWSDESYVRLYRRDTPAWLRLPWQARALYCEVLRKLDRAGVLPVDESATPAESVWAMCRDWPFEVLETALAQLLDRDWLIHDQEHSCLVDPEFLEREEAARSDAQRQRESRRRRSAKKAAPPPVTKRDAPITASHDESHGVTAGSEAADVAPAVTVRDASITNGDGVSRNVTHPSRPVTTSHEESHRVTPYRSPALPSVPSEIERSIERAGARADGPPDEYLSALAQAGWGGSRETLTDPREIELATRWWREGYALEALCPEIERMAASHRAKRPDDHIRLLTYFERAGRQGEAHLVGQRRRKAQAPKAWPKPIEPPEAGREVWDRLLEAARELIAEQLDADQVPTWINPLRFQGLNGGSALYVWAPTPQITHHHQHHGWLDEASKLAGLGLEVRWITNEESAR